MGDQDITVVLMHYGNSAVEGVNIQFFKGCFRHVSKRADQSAYQRVRPKE